MNIHIERIELGPAAQDAEHGHWRLETDDDGVAWLVLDQGNASANTLSGEVLDQLTDRLDEIDELTPKALVIRSAKPSGFVAGADISEFRGITDAEEIETRLKQGHALLDRIEAYPFPTIAVVHGFALGGGLELALACDYRLGIDGSSYGFPEVQLGLHPGLGGTFRLTELIDPVAAMSMMLTGRNAHTGKAEKHGIVDAVLEERHVRNAVTAVIDGRIEQQQAGLKDSALSLAPARAIAAHQMRSTTAQRAPREHYPAPYALIDLWEEHGGDRTAMQQAEIASFAELLAGPTAQNLVRVYFLREGLKNTTDSDHNIGRVHVVGAGAMGGDIAGWCALQGFRTTLSDMDNAPLAAAVSATARLCEDQHLTSTQTREALDRFMPDPKEAGIQTADLIIEAVPEDVQLKQKLYAALEPRMHKDAMLVTNTSSLDLEALADGLQHPERFAGLHFFNPVASMELVEVVEHNGTAANVMSQLTSFTTALKRLPAVASNYPGFLVNRALIPYLAEALLLLDEGIEAAVIDGAAEDFGMPMGPLQVADQVGLDVCLHVARDLSRNLEKPLPELPEWFHDKVADGKLGRKTGEGFYVWEDGKAQRDDDADQADAPDELTDRLILPMLDACVECLRHGVVTDEDVVDGAMIFATGFAPFHGGPMHYARQRGVEEIVARLAALAAEHGPRFKPDQGWSDLADTG